MQALALKKPKIGGLPPNGISTAIKPMDATAPNVAPAKAPAAAPAPATNVAPAKAPAAAPAPATNVAPATQNGLSSIAPAGKPGQWNVAKQLNKLVQGDSLFLRQAETAANQESQARGLLSSSMAVGAAQAARIASALPIAQQNAQQAFQLEQQRRDLGGQLMLQGNDIAAQFGLQQGQFEHAIKMAGIQFDQQKYLQGAELKASKEAQIRDIQSKYGLQRADAQSLMSRLQAELRSREKLQVQADRAAWTRLNRQLGSDAVLQKRAMQAQAFQAKLDRNLQMSLAHMNLDANARKDAQTAISIAQQAYSARYNAIMANTKLSATARLGAISRAQADLQKDLHVTETMFGIKINWPRTPGPKPKGGDNG